MVVFPTETVYGIAANTLSPQAMEKLSGIKERPKDKPFSLHIARKEEIEDFAREIPIAAYKLISRFWPGPMTVVLSSKDGGTIGMRMPDHRVALEVIAAAGVPVVCPSANLSGKPAPQDFSDALKDLRGKVELAIDAGKTSLGKESTVVDLTGSSPKILREGFIKKEEIVYYAQKI
jgi:L-threonylcarbamoyladenylate synthase